MTFNHISVTGTLFPGDAGASVITNTISIPVPSGSTYSASVPFSNVPVHDNEWAVLEFYGVASDGSMLDLGGLGGVLNVTSSSTNTATVTASTTLTLQVFLSLLYIGALSTYDLDHTPTLASTLTSDISATHTTTDSSTGLYDTPTLQTVDNTIGPDFERDVTITTSPNTAGAITIFQDYTNAEELNLRYSGELFLESGAYALNLTTPSVGNVIGVSGCGAFSVFMPNHTPALFPLAPESVDACLFPTNGSLTIHGVYGGNLQIGATNYTYGLTSTTPLASYVGGFAKSTGEAVGSFKVTVDVAADEHEYSVTDPAGFAFGPASSPSGTLFSDQPYVPSGLLSNATFTLSNETGSTPVTVPASYSATNNKIVVDTFTPWDLSDANQQICGGTSCYQLNTATTTTLTFDRPFDDPGTKLSYFDWTASGALKSVTTGSEGGYSLDFSTAGAGTMTTKTVSYLTPRELLEIESTLPPGTSWTLTATDADGNTYANTAVLTNGYAGELEMTSVYKLLTTKTIALTFTVPTAGTYTFEGLADECTYEDSVCY
jgi:hypothetical protein